jgi:hypothetical protein
MSIPTVPQPINSRSPTVAASSFENCAIPARAASGIAAVLMFVSAYCGAGTPGDGVRPASCAAGTPRSERRAAAWGAVMPGRSFPMIRTPAVGELVARPGPMGGAK